MDPITIHGVTVTETRCLDALVYSAWVPSSPTGKHCTITTINGKWYGRVGSGVEIDESLPAGSLERIDAVKRAYEIEYQIAYDAIILAYPELTHCRFDMGQVEIRLPGRSFASEVAS